MTAYLNTTPRCLLLSLLRVFHTANALKQLHSRWLNTYMILSIENVAVDLVNIRNDFMLLGSNSKPATGDLIFV